MLKFKAVTKVVIVVIKVYVMLQDGVTLFNYFNYVGRGKILNMVLSRGQISQSHSGFEPNTKDITISLERNKRFRKMEQPENKTGSSDARFKTHAGINIVYVQSVSLRATPKLEFHCFVRVISLILRSRVILRSDTPL